MQRPRLPGRLQPVLATLPSPSALVWLRRLLMWAVVWYIIRYVYFGNFLRGGSQQALYILSATIMLQTMVLYYVFAYNIFPRTLYKGRIGYALLWLFVWQSALYQINYWVFYWLHHIGDGGVAPYWQLFERWGAWGFVNNAAAIFYNFFWSFPLVTVLLTVKAVVDLISLRTRTIQLEKDKLVLELDFLKAQVNPHFLFNTLNSVYARVFDIDEQAGDLLLRLSELMRYNLYETNQPRVDLAKELAYIQNYLDLERNRLEGQPVVITYTQSGNVEPYQIAPLVLIAFVENAFKHGVRGGDKNAFVRVQAHVTDHQFVFTVENSVPPNRQVANDPIKKSGGIGLDNVRRRLSTLYPGQHELLISPGNIMYAARISIQL